jgi:ribosomal-protein-alanine N-acetyltransferase
MTEVLPPAFEIHTCGIEASPQFAAIHKRCFADAWDEAAMRQLLSMSNAFGLLGHARGVEESPAGCILVRVAADEAEILTLCVAEQARRMGLGLALVDGAVSMANERGAKAMFLEVAADNPAALQLYVNAGFSRAGQRPRYYARPDIAQDAWIMRRGI